MSVSAQELSRSRLIADRYRIDGVLAEGGMALVYRGWHVLLDQAIAVKVLREEYADSKEAVARFLQEAQVIAHLQGKHVAHVFDIGRIDGGAPFMVTELLDGTDLGQLLRAQGALSVESALDVMIATCHAVEEAHQHGIVHRDLKPDNLFLAREGDGGVCVKVLDFGVAKRLGAGIKLTESEHGVGSPHYMSPEQILLSQEADFRSDVWSLGVVLYELLTGDTPYNGLTIPNVCASILNEEIPQPSRLCDVPRGVERIIMTCLQKRPEYRYSSVAELRHTLEAVHRQRQEHRVPQIPATLDNARRRPARVRSILQNAWPLLMPSAGAALLIVFATPRWEPLQQVSGISASAPVHQAQQAEPQAVPAQTLQTGSDVVRVDPVMLPTPPLQDSLGQDSMERKVLQEPRRAVGSTAQSEPHSARPRQGERRFATSPWDPWERRRSEVADPVEADMGHDLIDPYPDLR